MTINSQGGDKKRKFLKEAAELIEKHKIDIDGFETEELFVFSYSVENNFFSIYPKNNLSKNLTEEAKYLINQIKIN